MDKNTSTQNDLFNAIGTGDREAIKASALSDKALLDLPNQQGFTPLILATYSNQHEVVQLLIDLGADVNTQGAAGNTALMGVCFKGFIEIAELLISHGAELNIQNEQGATALLYAAQFGKWEIVRMLVEHGADTSIKDHHGNTALTHAKMQNNKSMIDLLSQ